MVALFYSSRVGGELKVAAMDGVFSCLTYFRKSWDQYRIALRYSAPFSGLFTEFGQTTSGGKMYGQHLH